MNTCNRIKIMSLPYNHFMGEKKLVIVPAKILKWETYLIKGSIKFGLSIKDVNIISHPLPDIIRLSKDVMDKLNIYEGMEVDVKYDHNMLTLGPVIGFITRSWVLKKILDGAPSQKIVQTMKAARQANVFLYFFSIYDITWGERSVNAVIYNPITDSWENRKMPLPDVIYDRGHAEGLSEVKMKRELSIRNRLNHFKGLNRINAQHYFDKWDLYCRLSKHEDMKKYLPETVLNNGSTENLKSMIDKYSTVYLKACIGSNGKSVMRVKKVNDSSYEYDHFRLELVRKDTDNLSYILETADEYMRKSKYIIQQGIDVLTYEGNKVDVRVLVQKDKSGNWRITNMPVRIAVDNCPVTSTKSGSNVYKFDEAFLNILKLDPKQVRSIEKGIHELICTAVDTIEKEYGPFGELGIDVAIDKDYGVWFLESNSKPAKDTIIKSGSEEDIKNAFLPPFIYARHLSGFDYADNLTEEPLSSMTPEI